MYLSCLILGTPGTTKKAVKRRRYLSDIQKNQHNLRTILLYSNANLIKKYDASGFGCQFCTQQFSEPKLLKEHFLREHKLQQLVKGITCKLFNFFVKLDITDLKCTLCDQRQSKLDHFIYHIKAQHDIDVYKRLKSSIVPFKFDTEKLTCVECGKEYLTFKHLMTHMNEHFKNHICPTCGKGFVTSDQFKVHVWRHKSAKMKCKYCDKSFANQDRLTNHQRRVHLGDKKRNKCNFCGKKFADYVHKTDHMVKVHGANEVFAVCDICDKRFKDHRRLNVHIRKDHLLEKKYECEVCAADFFSASDRKRHMVTHTGEKKYQCDICKKSYGTKNTLREHMRGHLNDRRYKCELCGKGFVHNCTLRSHMKLIHFKDNVHAKPDFALCHICDKRFKDEGLLNVHVKKAHLLEKKYECSVCGTDFFSTLDLRRHKVTHAGVRFECDICKKSYVRKYTLVEHMRKHLDDLQ
ncbi:zinc finger protein 43-like [Bicyclus anynana]|uniref:Zinc finger protein 43-like n=1 Tax=Bicyclus anynana TaxID=110368 RepID=A0ABM3M3H7_BICAN|nr:zinc finger protein 43-like [Bicyclus anynana]